MPDSAQALSPAILAKAAAMVALLREYHALGARSLQSKQKTREFADANGLNMHLVSKCRAFNRHFPTPKELERFCSLRRPNGLPLHFGHANVLGVVPRKGRLAVAQQIAEQGWSAPRAHQSIKEKYRKKKRHHGGRPLQMPTSAAEHLRLAVAEAAFFYRRHHGLLQKIDVARGKGKGLRKKLAVDAKMVFSQLENLAGALRRNAGPTRRK